MKTLLPLACTLLVTSLNTFALDLVKNPLVLECFGSTGSAHFEQTNQGVHYTIQTPAEHFQGFVAAYHEGSGKWEQGSVHLIEPATGAKKKWMSVSAIHGTKVFTPAHKGCLITRANTCADWNFPASYANQPDEWLELMVDLSVSGKVSFMSLNLGKKNVSGLGAKVQCSLKVN